ncbi:thionin-like protein 2 [Apium graveolens]|uniref:thionin-like protein 2 n=1 Tax=Apium graveolens TaxID=4045 RepID=UPI003D7BA893
MEGMKFRSMVVAMVVAAALLVPGQADPGSFKDCYIKCYVFCIIEPSQTLCSCTTQCFKNCILPGYSTSVTVQRNDDRVSNANQNYAFCKLGCASSCSNISTNKNPNGDNMEKCVGSCSQKCDNTYSSNASSP